MRIRIVFSGLILLAAIVLAGRPSRSSAETAPAWKVIVNSKNPATSISKGSLGKIFLKKTTAWSGDKKIQPVDQTVSSPVRDAFSRAVHGKSARGVKAWWSQQIYGGKGVPPPEVSGDAKVIAFVEQNEGAIGYIAADTAVSNVTVLNVTE